jgi:hypothetical protein
LPKWNLIKDEDKAANTIPEINDLTDGHSSHLFSVEITPDAAAAAAVDKSMVSNSSINSSPNSS